MMSLLVRGIVWFGAYVALVLLPLAGAAWVDPIAAPRRLRVELAAAFGFIGFAATLIQFALVSRLRGASRPFGADALLQFHRQMGLVSLLFVIAHPLLLRMPAATWSPFDGTTGTRTGAIALWAMVLLAATSLVRRQLRLSYEAWQAIHLGAALLGGGAMIAHVFAVGPYAEHPAMRGLLTAYAVAFIALTATVPPAMTRRRFERASGRSTQRGARTWSGFSPITARPRPTKTGESSITSPRKIRARDREITREGAPGTRTRGEYAEVRAARPVCDLPFEAA